MKNKTIAPIRCRKGQGSFEMILTLMILLFIIISFLYVRIWQSVQDITDVNDVALARASVDRLKAAVDVVGLSPVGTVKDLTVHIPLNTVDLKCNLTSVEFTVLLYSQDPNLCDPADTYVTKDGVDTVYCYKTITAQLGHNVSVCQLCDPNTHQTRGQAWIDLDGNEIEFCCDAGFNMHTLVRKDPNMEDPGNVQILQRRYWELIDENNEPHYWQI